jgi:hypothetical protein
MFRLISASVLILFCAISAACADDDTPTAPVEQPIQLTESFSGTIGINGAATHQFVTTRTGQVGATLTALSPDSTAVISFMLGTWNGSYCAISTSGLAKDDATTGSILGASATIGNFCVRVSDVGRLTAPTSYEIVVTHF